ncbi:hypothetical protein SBADM41S_03016 [Streptomyces badius]
MYFAALLARTEDGWEASDTELDDVETLSDLTDLAREASVDEDTVLVYIEQEDAWFGVVRVDGEEDPRIYVSDASAAARSSYGEILLTDEMLGREPGAEDEIAALEELVTTEHGGRRTAANRAAPRGRRAPDPDQPPRRAASDTGSWPARRPLRERPLRCSPTHLRDAAARGRSPPTSCPLRRHGPLMPVVIGPTAVAARLRHHPPHVPPRRDGPQGPRVTARPRTSHPTHLTRARGRSRHSSGGTWTGPRPELGARDLGIEMRDP